MSEYAIKFSFSKFLNYFKSQLPGHITETPNAYYPVSTVKTTFVKRFLYNHTGDKKNYTALREAPSRYMFESHGVCMH